MEKELVDRVNALTTVVGALAHGLSVSNPILLARVRASIEERGRINEATLKGPGAPARLSPEAVRLALSMLPQP